MPDKISAISRADVTPNWKFVRTVVNKVEIKVNVLLDLSSKFEFEVTLEA